MQVIQIQGFVISINKIPTKQNEKNEKKQQTSDRNISEKVCGKEKKNTYKNMNE